MKIEDIIDITNLQYKWDIIENIPEFAYLKECQQNPKWHAEGNVWNHTVLVTNEALKYIKNNTSSNLSKLDKIILLTAALFHDIGKGVTTEFKKGNWHAYGHELKSDIITRRLLWEEEVIIREEICALVKYHMEPLRTFKTKHYIENVIYLSGNVRLNLLLQLKIFDILGSQCQDKKHVEFDIEQLNNIKQIALSLNCYYNKSNVLDNNLIINYNNLEPIHVHVMIGISGAGKSTEVEKICQNYHQQNIEKNIVVISRDIARIKLGFCQEGTKYLGTTEEENAVTEYCQNLIKQSAKKGDIIIIDDMNLKKKYRDNIKTLLSEFNCVYYYHYIETQNIETNIERRKHQIKSDVIQNMINSIEWPIHQEYNHLFISIN